MFMGSFLPNLPLVAKSKIRKNVAGEVFAFAVGQKS